MSLKLSEYEFICMVNKLAIKNEVEFQDVLKNLLSWDDKNDILFLTMDERALDLHISTWKSNGCFRMIVNELIIDPPP